MKNMFCAAVKMCAASSWVLFALTNAAIAQTVFDKTIGNYSVVPRSIDSGVAPMMMLAMSNDHQLYFKAYTDYDRVVGFDPIERYIGYFDNTRCYSYTGDKGSASAYFAMGKKSNPVRSYCNRPSGGDLWSGNFLNWATMTRIDVLRKILYGGKRAEANYNRTILERSYLPNDAHSFAKYYAESDLQRLVPLASITPSGATGEQPGVTFCNTTLHDGTVQKRYSYRNDNPPLMRAIRGNYSLWASGERFQCLYQGEFSSDAPGDTGVAVSGNDAEVATIRSLFDGFGFSPQFTAPAASLIKNDFSVRVEACPRNKANDLSGCSQYPNGSWRPTGVLHTHGEDEQVQFGLVSGSYEKNKTGGFLRKNTGFITEEINPGNGKFVTPANGEGLIAHIDALRITSWDFLGQGYNHECTFNLENFNDGKCRDWGNPLGEVMQEAYSYFAGQSAANSFTKTQGARPVSEAGGVPLGVVKAPWSPPIGDSNYCAKLSVLGLNTSAQSFDHDGLNLTSITTDTGGLGGATLVGLTKEIGRQEDFYDAGKEFFVGVSGAQNNGLCTPKTLNDLSAVTGACPEAPRLKGSWNLAGLAQYAFENDINNYNNKDEGFGSHEVLQRVETFGIELATALPKVVISRGNKNVTIIPACENINSGNCAIVDFKVLRKSATSGAVYVNFEDSEQGGDYDQDMHGILSYSLLGGSLTVTTDVIGQSTDRKMAFGYVITGVAPGAGFHAHSGINGYDKSDCSSLLNPLGKASCSKAHDQSSKTYAISSGDEITPLPSPLQLAAKYGNSAPASSYYKSDTPEKLEEGLSALFGLNGPTPLASTAGLVSTSGSRGANILLHTFFSAQKESDGLQNKESISWVGNIGALYIDDENRLREDTIPDGVLDNRDRIVKFDGAVDAIGQALVTFEAIGTGAKVEAQPLEDIQYIWSASDQLAAVGDNGGNYTAQNNTYSIADAGVNRRFIYTRVPNNLNNTNVITGDLQPFTERLFKAGNVGNAPLLGGVNDTDNLVNFIRGEEGITGMRSRTLGGKKHLLGDIIGSSPLIASTPKYSYFEEFGDAGYKLYKNAYKAERNVVYAAANDGMIHAFDAGVFDFNQKSYTGNLGAELWAYIPFNVLPHLQWLSSPYYSHVPYVDGFLGTFDVKMFTPDNVHVGGWGTILVAGTGQGGGDYPIDNNGDGNADVTTRPAFVILDVTDRNGPPKLIAEITHEELGFTVGEPDVIRHVDLDDPSKNSWFLVFGSGPRGHNDLSKRTAQLNYEIQANPTANLGDRKARLFTFRLSPTPNANALTATVVNAADVESFIGGVNGMDWNRDYTDDAIYFGLVEGTAQNPDGKLMRASLGFTGANALNLTPSVMLNTNKPVVGRPTTLLDANNNYWVFAGSGRYFSKKEGGYTHNGNLYLGVKEAKLDEKNSPGAVGTTTFTQTNLFNTSGIRVFRDSTLKNAALANGDPLTSITELRDVIANGDTSNPTTRHYDGWFFDLESNERQITETAYSAGILFFNSAQATGNVRACNVNSGGYAYEIDFLAGVASPRSRNIKSEITDANGVDVSEVENKKATDTEQGKRNPDIPYQATGKAEIIAVELPSSDVESTRASWREVPMPF